MFSNLLITTVLASRGPAIPGTDPLRLVWDQEGYAILQLSPQQAETLTLSISLRAQLATDSYGDPHSFSSYPQPDREMLTQALILTPFVLNQIEAGRVGQSDPLRKVGEALAPIWEAALLLAGMDPSMDTVLRPTLYNVADRARAYALQHHPHTYNPDTYWATNLSTLSLWTADRPLQVGAALLKAQAAAQPVLLPDTRIGELDRSYEATIAWYRVASEASHSAVEQAETALLASTMSLTFADRAADSVVMSAETLGSVERVELEGRALNNALWWVNRSRTSLKELEEAGESHPGLVSQARSTFARAVLRRERLRMDLIDAGVIAEIKEARPTRADVQMVWDGYELGTPLSPSLLGLALEMEVETGLTDDDYRRAILELQHINRDFARTPASRRAVCEDIVSRRRLFLLDEPSGSLREPLARLAQGFSCELKGEAAAVLEQE